MIDQARKQLAALTAEKKQAEDRIDKEQSRLSVLDAQITAVGKLIADAEKAQAATAVTAGKEGK